LEEKLGLLRELQGLDGDLQKITRDCQGLEQELDGSRENLGRIQEIVDDLADEMATLEADQRELSQSIIHEEGLISRAEERLPEIKTQKEYVAVLKEVDTAKATMRDLRTKMDDLSGQLLSLSEDRETKETELADLKIKIDERQAEIDKSLKVINADLKKKADQRDELLEQVPKQIQSRYRILIERRAGIAVVEAKKGACTGCNMNLPPQLFNSLFLAKEIQSCPHCNRMLFVNQNPA